MYGCPGWCMTGTCSSPCTIWARTTGWASRTPTFPTQAFDAYYIQRNWAFGMKGNGYVELTASAPVRLVQSGPTARQNLRAAGSRVVWTLQMGRREQNGEFREFRARVLELPLTVDGLDVRFESLRGDRYEFGWAGPLLKNGEEVPLSGYPHIGQPVHLHAAPCREHGDPVPGSPVAPAPDIAVPTRGYRYSKPGPRSTKPKPCHNPPNGLAIHAPIMQNS